MLVYSAAIQLTVVRQNLTTPNHLRTQSISCRRSRVRCPVRGLVALTRRRSALRREAGRDEAIGRFRSSKGRAGGFSRTGGLPNLGRLRPDIFRRLLTKVPSKRYRRSRPATGSGYRKSVHRHRGTVDKMGTNAVRLYLPFLRRSGTGWIPTSARRGCLENNTHRPRLRPVSIAQRWPGDEAEPTLANLKGLAPVFMSGLCNQAGAHRSPILLSQPWG